jgi:hypothetical protein
MDVQHQRYVEGILGPQTKLGRKITIAGIIESMRDGVENDILGRAKRQAEGLHIGRAIDWLNFWKGVIKQAGKAVGAVTKYSRQPALLQGKMSMEEFENAGYLLRPGKLRDISIFERQVVEEAAHTAATKAWPAGVSVLASILQVYAMFSAAGKLDDAIQKGDKTGEAKLYFTAAAFGTVHAVGEAFERFEKIYPKHARLIGLTGKKLTAIKVVSKGFGFTGAGIGVGLSVNDAYKAYQNDQRGMAALYLVSAGLNAAGMWLIVSATAIPIGLPLFVIGIAVMLAIAMFKDDDLQDWLGRCVFGKDHADKFPSLEAEMRVYNTMYSNAQIH